MDSEDTSETWPATNQRRLTGGGIHRMDFRPVNQPPIISRNTQDKNPKELVREVPVAGTHSRRSPSTSGRTRPPITRGLQTEIASYKFERPLSATEVH